MNLDNPFYYNPIFSNHDLKRPGLCPWHYPFLYLVSTKVQLNYGYIFYYKIWFGKVYLLKIIKRDLSESSKNHPKKVNKWRVANKVAKKSRKINRHI